MAQGDYDPLRFNDNLNLPHGSYWQSRDYVPLSVRYPKHIYPADISTGTQFVRCPKCGMVRLWYDECEYCPEPLTSDEIIWCEVD